jgi:hypothetical protein
MILTIRQSRSQIKRSARQALRRANALYLWADVNPNVSSREILGSVLKSNDDLLPQAVNLPSYTSATFTELVAQLRRLKETVAA